MIQIVGSFLGVTRCARQCFKEQKKHGDKTNVMILEPGSWASSPQHLSSPGCLFIHCFSMRRLMFSRNCKKHPVGVAPYCMRSESRQVDAI